MRNKFNQVAKGYDTSISRRRWSSKKSKKAARQLEKAAAAVKKKERKKSQPHPLNFSALHLLHDPQGFAEQLFQKHLQTTKSKLNLEQKLLVLQLVSRLIGLHKLTVISFYSYFLKYLTPKQAEVTSFLASLAQSVHNQVPPDIIEPLIQKIANEFVSEASAGEVAAAGLNAIREICVRQPLAMSDTLLQDLVMYKKSKDKGVMMAAKGLLGLYRQVGAEMLRKRDRGKDAVMGLKSGEQKLARFGEEAPGEIEGLELLERWKEDERRRKRLEKGLTSDDEVDEKDDDEEDWNAWDIQSENSDDSGGWINVESDEEIDINLSDSDDEKEKKKGREKETNDDTKPVAKRVKFASEDDVLAIDENKENTPRAETTSLAVTSILKSSTATASSEPDISSPPPPAQEQPSKAPPSLATTRILTPADLAKLHELRTTASISSHLPKSHKSHHASSTLAAQQHSATLSNSQRNIDLPLTASHITGLSHLSASKATRAERMASLADAKQDQAEQHKSKAARKKERKEEQGKSTTNKEKARKKNFLMTLGKAKRKGKRSLVQHQKILRAHETRAKKGGRRGNRD